MTIHNTGYGNQKSAPRRKILKQGAVPTRNLPISQFAKHANRATKFHSPELQRGAPQNCFICNSMGVADEPRFCCGKCQVNLCLKPCFKVNLIFLSFVTFHLFTYWIWFFSKKKPRIKRLLVP